MSASSKMLLARTVIRRTFGCQSCSVIAAFTQLKRFAAAVVDFTVFRVCSQRMSVPRRRASIRQHAYLWGLKRTTPQQASFRSSKFKAYQVPLYASPGLIRLRQGRTASQCGTFGMQVDHNSERPNSYSPKSDLRSKPATPKPIQCSS